MIKSRKISGHLAHMCEKADAYIVLIKRSERQRPVGKPRCKWEDI
jgi:hypothetical protein